jgi:hypothetical protein
MSVVKRFCFVFLFKFGKKKFVATINVAHLFRSIQN